MRVFADSQVPTTGRDRCSFDSLELGLKRLLSLWTGGPVHLPCQVEQLCSERDLFFEFAGDALGALDGGDLVFVCSGFERELSVGLRRALNLQPVGSHIASAFCRPALDR
jgi:hypothetical protein